MILLLNTSTPECHLSFIEDGQRYDTSWTAGRELAKGLLEFLDRELEQQNKSWQNVTGLVVYKGPGSFTGLRIGVTVMNTLAHANNWPIVGTTGDTWQADGLARIEAGENDEIVIPEYGGEANITKPRK